MTRLLASFARVLVVAPCTPLSRFLGTHSKKNKGVRFNLRHTFIDFPRPAPGPHSRLQAQGLDFLLSPLLPQLWCPTHHTTSW